MSPTIVGTTKVDAQGALTITLTMPPAQPGDVLIVALRNQNGDATTDYTLPSGWKRVSGLPWDPQSLGGPRLTGLFAMQVSQSTPRPEQASFTVSKSGRHIGVAISVRGVQLEGFAGSDYYGTQITNGVQLTGPKSPAAKGFALVLAGAECTSGVPATPVATPPGFNKIESMATAGADTVTRTAIWVGGKATSPDESLAGDQVVWAGGTGFAAQAVVLPEAVVGPAPGFPAFDGSKKPAELHVKTSTGTAPVLDVKRVNRGYGSVAEMLTAKTFYWAHRGGSKSYPEHSLWAYTQSAIRGFGAFEISTARTKDGKWVGLHDPDLASVTNGASSTPVAQMTWAEVQKFQVVTGDSGSPKPFMLWDELVAAYGSTHVVIADPKLAQPEFMPEFWGMLSSLGPSRAIVKYFYTNTQLADAARARGFKSWGYMYEANLTDDASWRDKASKWDMLGLEYSASQSAWDSVRSLGKPVVGHICPDQAAVDAALSKGAAGVQCSGVAAIIVR